MIQTLKTYIGKDLIKSTLLTAAPLTLLLTIFAVIEPLRSRGLSGQQALRLFSYMVPVMFSFTLPIAALFAATIVYGRFAQDNELMACRASGISILSILRPAAWLGAIVSAITLLLTLYVAPHLLWYVQNRVKNNIQQIVYHNLKTSHYMRLERKFIHADNIDTDSGWMQGVLAANLAKPEDVRLVVASRAWIDFTGDAEVIVDPDGMVAGWTPAAETLYGYPAADIVKKPFLTLFPAGMAGTVKASLSLAMQGRPQENIDEVPCLMRRGDRMDVALSMRPIRGPDHIVTGVSVVARDFRQSSVRVYPSNPVALRQSGGAMPTLEQVDVQSADLPPLEEDEPRLQDWTALVHTRAYPGDNALVKQELRKIARTLTAQGFYEQVKAASDSGNIYPMLEPVVKTVPVGMTAAAEGGATSTPAPPPQRRVELTVPPGQTWTRSEEELGLGEQPPPETSTTAPAPTTTAATAPATAPAVIERRVLVREFEGDKLRRQIAARSGRVRVDWSGSRSGPLAEITLLDVDVKDYGRRADLSLGPYEIPAKTLVEASGVNFDKFYATPEKYEDLRQAVDRLLARVKAEMHQRLAYGLGCLLLVMLGAALGLMFRSGQVLAAFTVALAPGAVMGLMLFMGKGLLKDPRINPVYGISSIWGGVAILAAATLYIYARPMRR